MKQLINKTNIGKTILILCGVALVVFALRWKLYIDMLNSNSVNYEYSINCECMGTSAIGEDLMYIVTKKGETSFVSDFVVSSDTVVYRKRVYEYWDFPLLIGDYSCVDYEFHFVNVDTKEEEIYRIKPFEATGIMTGKELYTYDRFSCYIVDGEKKMFFRYYQNEGVGEGILYGVIISQQWIRIGTVFRSIDSLLRTNGSQLRSTCV